ncbi:MAG: hypothetical protein EXR33_08780 [Betaproteobacteria bacterium]|nr:hypothetical protein [Betaproteobacteria bacterium]
MTPIGALEASAIGVALRDVSWLFAAVKAVHLAGIAMLVGSIAVLDLRLLGLRRSVPVRRLAGRILPWTAASFCLIVPSGLAMFVANAGELIASPVFAVKICLILLAGANAGLFHAGVFRRAARWDADVMPPIAARTARRGISRALGFSDRLRAIAGPGLAIRSPVG